MLANSLVGIGKGLGLLSIYIYDWCVDILFRVLNTDLLLFLSVTWRSLLILIGFLTIWKGRVDIWYVVW